MRGIFTSCSGILLNRVKRKVILMAIASKALPMHKNWDQGSWRFGATLTGDVGHQVQADLDLVRSGAKTRSQIAAEYNNDWSEVMEKNGAEIVTGCWLPVGGQQDAQVVLVGHGWQAFEHVGEPGFGVVAVALGAFDHGVDDGGPLAGGFAADERASSFFQLPWDGCRFRSVVVDFNFTTCPEEAAGGPRGRGCSRWRGQVGSWAGLRGAGAGRAARP
jgi:hypothetical protein